MSSHQHLPPAISQLIHPQLLSTRFNIPYEIAAKLGVASAMTLYLELTSDGSNRRDLEEILIIAHQDEMAAKLHTMNTHSAPTHFSPIAPILIPAPVHITPSITSLASLSTRDNEDGELLDEYRGELRNSAHASSPLLSPSLHYISPQPTARNITPIPTHHGLEPGQQMNHGLTSGAHFHPLNLNNLHSPLSPLSNPASSTPLANTHQNLQHLQPILSKHYSFDVFSTPVSSPLPHSVQNQFNPQGPYAPSPSASHNSSSIHHRSTGQFISPIPINTLTSHPSNASFHSQSSPFAQSNSLHQHHQQQQQQYHQEQQHQQHQQKQTGPINCGCIYHIPPTHPDFHNQSASQKAFLQFPSCYICHRKSNFAPTSSLLALPMPSPLTVATTTISSTTPQQHFLHQLTIDSPLSSTHSIGISSAASTHNHPHHHSKFHQNPHSNGQHGARANHQRMDSTHLAPFDPHHHQISPHHGQSKSQTDTHPTTPTNQTTTLLVQPHPIPPHLLSSPLRPRTPTSTSQSTAHHHHAQPSVHPNPGTSHPRVDSNLPQSARPIHPGPTHQLAFHWPDQTTTINSIPINPVPVLQSAQTVHINSNGTNNTSGTNGTNTGSSQDDFPLKTHQHNTATTITPANTSAPNGNNDNNIQNSLQHVPFFSPSKLQQMNHQYDQTHYKHPHSLHHACNHSNHQQPCPLGPQCTFRRADHSLPSFLQIDPSHDLPTLSRVSSTATTMSNTTTMTNQQTSLLPRTRRVRFQLTEVLPFHSNDTSADKSNLHLSPFKKKRDRDFDVLSNVSYTVSVASSTGALSTAGSNGGYGGANVFSMQQVSGMHDINYGRTILNCISIPSHPSLPNTPPHAFTPTYDPHTSSHRHHHPNLPSNSDYDDKSPLMSPITLAFPDYPSPPFDNGSTGNNNSTNTHLNQSTGNIAIQFSKLTIDGQSEHQNTRAGIPSPMSSVSNLNQLHPIHPPNLVHHKSSDSALSTAHSVHGSSLHPLPHDNISSMRTSTSNTNLHQAHHLQQTSALSQGHPLSTGLHTPSHTPLQSPLFTPLMSFHPALTIESNFFHPDCHVVYPGQGDDEDEDDDDLYHYRNSLTNQQATVMPAHHHHHQLRPISPSVPKTSKTTATNHAATKTSSPVTINPVSLHQRTNSCSLGTNRPSPPKPLTTASTSLLHIMNIDQTSPNSQGCHLTQTGHDLPQLSDNQNNSHPLDRQGSRNPKATTVTIHTTTSTPTSTLGSLPINIPPPVTQTPNQLLNHNSVQPQHPASQPVFEDFNLHLNLDSDPDDEDGGDLYDFDEETALTQLIGMGTRERSGVQGGPSAIAGDNSQMNLPTIIAGQVATNTTTAMKAVAQAPTPTSRSATAVATSNDLSDKLVQDDTNPPKGEKTTHLVLRRSEHLDRTSHSGHSTSTGHSGRSTNYRHHQDITNSHISNHATPTNTTINDSAHDTITPLTLPSDPHPHPRHTKPLPAMHPNIITTPTSGRERSSSKQNGQHSPTCLQPCNSHIDTTGTGNGNNNGNSVSPLAPHLKRNHSESTHHVAPRPSFLARQLQLQQQQQEQHHQQHHQNDNHNLKSSPQQQQQQQQLQQSQQQQNQMHQLPQQPHALADDHMYAIPTLDHVASSSQSVISDSTSASASAISSANWRTQDRTTVTMLGGVAIHRSIHPSASASTSSSTCASHIILDQTGQQNSQPPSAHFAPALPLDPQLSQLSLAMRAPTSETQRVSTSTSNTNSVHRVSHTSSASSSSLHALLNPKSQSNHQNSHNNGSETTSQSSQNQLNPLAIPLPSRNPSQSSTPHATGPLIPTPLEVVDLHGPNGVQIRHNNDHSHQPTHPSRPSPPTRFSRTSTPNSSAVLQLTPYNDPHHHHHDNNQSALTFNMLSNHHMQTASMVSTTFQNSHLSYTSISGDYSRSVGLVEDHEDDSESLVTGHHQNNQHQHNHHQNNHHGRHNHNNHPQLHQHQPQQQNQHQHQQQQQQHTHSISNYHATLSPIHVVEPSYDTGFDVQPTFIDHQRQSISELLALMGGQTGSPSNSGSHSGSPPQNSPHGSTPHHHGHHHDHQNQQQHPDSDHLHSPQHLRPSPFHQTTSFIPSFAPQPPSRPSNSSNMSMLIQQHAQQQQPQHQQQHQQQLQPQRTSQPQSFIPQPQPPSLLIHNDGNYHNNNTTANNHNHGLDGNHYNPYDDQHSPIPSPQGMTIGSFYPRTNTATSHMPSNPTNIPDNNSSGAAYFGFNQFGGNTTSSHSNTRRHF